MPQLKLTFKIHDRESTITGFGCSGPAPLIFPPWYSIRFKEGYKIEGDSWRDENFPVESCKVEYDNKTYQLPKSSVNQIKEDGRLNIMIRTEQPPNGEMLPFFSDSLTLDE